MGCFTIFHEMRLGIARGEGWRWQPHQSSTIHGARAEVLRAGTGSYQGQWMSCLGARAVCDVVIVATATRATLARMRRGVKA